MNKAILVIDMPSCCNECPICASYAESAFSPREYWCVASENTDVDPYNKPSWCPLKPPPEKYDMEYAITHSFDEDGDYELGWNQCIDNILGA